MSASVAVNVTFYARHAKDGAFLPACDHWQWLLESVQLLEELCDWPIVVVLSAFPGFEVAASERAILWQLWQRPRVHLVAIGSDYGHQVGHASCIFYGLEAAQHLGCDYFLNTAEDIVPEPAAMQQMIQSLKETPADFVSEAWGHELEQHECSSAFFACRVDAFLHTLDAGAVLAHAYLERYLHDLLVAGKKKILRTGPTFGPGIHWGRTFRTTHDFSLWRQFADQIKSPTWTHRAYQFLPQTKQDGLTEDWNLPHVALCGRRIGLEKLASDWPSVTCLDCLSRRSQLEETQ